VSTTDNYRAEKPLYLWYCGTKKYRKGEDTGKIEKWYRGTMQHYNKGSKMHQTVRNIFLQTHIEYR